MILFQNFIFSQEIKMLTYNIRYDDLKDNETSWSHRKEFLSNQLKFYNPDIFGTQEGLINQLNYIDSVLVDYQFVGVGRDDGKELGEHCAIFYNTKRFKVVEQSTFWLSPTPNVVSMGWGARLNRICTYALFQNIKTKKYVWVFNVHFDHISDLARENSAKLIIGKMDTLNQENYPVILMGDFNLEPESNPIQYLSSLMDDSRYSSRDLVFGNDGTFNNFEFNKPPKARIDYIFTSKSNIQVLKYAVLSDSKNCQYPSDHLPVYVEIELKR
jgi:endonuclease/exonuclease/phosphatase family metal-dependent hydrolase